MNFKYHFVTTSALTKARLDDNINAFTPQTGATALRGDKHFFSVLIKGVSIHNGLRLNMEIDSPLKECITSYVVDQIPVRQPCYPDRFDSDYLDTKPGLFPDLLRPATAVYATSASLSQLYFEVRVPEDTAPGRYPICIRFTQDTTGEAAGEATYELEVLDAQLPLQKLTVAHWFHYDCLASYYGVEVFSEAHWTLIENFLAAYVDRGSNSLLTPIFTPPLDTKVGGERPTVQLVDVTRENGNYTFGFDKLKRFCEMCKRYGIKELEIAHFFTQWGAEHAPKIMATDDGVYRRIFGWETESDSDEYIGFLRALIPAVREQLDALGYKDHYYFHISDEPREQHLERYSKVKNAILDLIGDRPVRDALSSFAFYENGVISNPIPGNNHLEPFLEAQVPDLWTYYCCSQSKEVSNRFVAMPGYRTRVLGTQLFKFALTGFLQWGYNYYYNQYSIDEVNPFLNIEGDMFTPAGDNLMVYPGKDGKPLHSLHELLFEQALLDVRAMDAAAEKVGREAVIAAIDAEGEVSFKQYPRCEDYLLTLRDTVNRMAAGK